MTTAATTTATTIRFYSEDSSNNSNINGSPEGIMLLVLTVTMNDVHWRWLTIIDVVSSINTAEMRLGIILAVPLKMYRH